MIKLVKALHLLGVAMFLGSILGHVTVGFIPGASEDPGTALVARQAIELATSSLTMPGLLLLLVTGSAMLLHARHGLLARRWMLLHALIGILILLNAIFVLYPTGQEAIEAAVRVAAGDWPMARLLALEGREAAFGAANLTLSLVALFVAVLKPRLGRRAA